MYSHARARESIVKQVASPTRKLNIFFVFSTYTGVKLVLIIRRFLACLHSGVELSSRVIARVLSDLYLRLEELIDEDALFLKIFLF